MNLKKIKLAKTVLNENSKILYGIFGVVESSGYFPTREILNGFLMQGNDPCDQDGRMSSWQSFELDELEYDQVQAWWVSNHPDVKTDSMGHHNWNNWIDDILDLE